MSSVARRIFASLAPTIHGTSTQGRNPQRPHRIRRTRGVTLAAASSAALLALSACSDGGSVDAPAEDDSTIKIVASTSIWGDITEELVGADESGRAGTIEVVTIMSSNVEDPHTYEATARDLAELRSADIVVAGGGGYDTWMTDNVAEGTELITALPLAKHEDGHDHGDVNPHIWFDMNIVDQFATDVSDALNERDPGLDIDPTAVTDRTSDLRTRIESLPPMNVLLTESIAEPLVEQSAMKDVTPKGFAEAVADEAEPAAADLSKARDEITDGKVDVLISNRQSQAAASTELISTAEDEDVPVVNINETPEPGQDYFDYVSTVVDDLEDEAE